MNAVCLSPHFPPTYYQFATGLRAAGLDVFGIGESSHHELSGELQRALTEYRHVGQLENYEEVYRAMAHLISRHGRMELVESHTEYWLPLEAKLREDFNLPGPKPAETAYRRSKTGMAELFGMARVPSIIGKKYESDAQVLAFANEHGFPLMLKPDTGVGAARTFIVLNATMLDEAIKHGLAGYIVQRYIRGELFSYDGIVDAHGQIIFATGHVYSSGIAEVVRDNLDIHYYSLRKLPRELEDSGRRVVEAFGIRRRFFHIEFFKLPNGEWCGLEVNMRPPGGFTTDMMNYSADIDVYRMWADMVAGKPAPEQLPERTYHSAHVGRRWDRAYKVPHDEVVRQLGPALMLYTPVPRAFSAVMADDVYLIRHADEAKLKEAIALIQGR